MRTIYLECGMGAAGDMLTAALLELLPDSRDFLRRLNDIGLPGVAVTAEKMMKCGIAGTHVSVTVHGQREESEDVLGFEEHHEHIHGHYHAHDDDHRHGHTPHDGSGHVHNPMHRNSAAEHDCHSHAHTHADPDHAHDHAHHDSAGGHHHAGLPEIEHIVSHLKIPEAVQRDVLAVYRLIAEAESAAHDKPVTEVHFHEVGAMDAVADVTAVCMLLHELAPERIAASPVNVGSGHVHCAHGILPVPAPAAAYLLKGVPTYGSEIRGELCTPTGAALLKYFVKEFGPQPVMRVEKIGYGCGTKDFARTNCVRASLGQTQEQQESVVELCCNLDDMSPEAAGFAMERLFEAGALDVYTVPAGMKKNRPGILFTCVCRSEQRDEMIRLLFQHTTTLGVRENICGRYALDRSVKNVQTSYGSVRVKYAEGWGIRRKKAEYDDLARIAAKEGISLQQARDAAEEISEK